MGCFSRPIVVVSLEMSDKITAFEFSQSFGLNSNSHKMKDTYLTGR